MPGPTHAHVPPSAWQTIAYASAALAAFFTGHNYAWGASSEPVCRAADPDLGYLPSTKGIIQAHLARESVGPPATLAFIGALAISLMSALFDFSANSALD